MIQAIATEIVKNEDVTIQILKNYAEAIKTKGVQSYYVRDVPWTPKLGKKLTQ